MEDYKKYKDKGEELPIEDIDDIKQADFLERFRKKFKKADDSDKNIKKSFENWL